MKNDLCICCNLFLARLEIELCQASAAYVMTGRIAYLYTVTRLGYDIPHVALEHRTRLFRMCSSLFSRYCVWGNQSNLQSSIIPRYFIFEMMFSPHSAILGWLLYNSLFLINIGINAGIFSLDKTNSHPVQQGYYNIHYVLQNTLIFHKELVHNIHETYQKKTYIHCDTAKTQVQGYVQINAPIWHLRIVWRQGYKLWIQEDSTIIYDFSQHHINIHQTVYNFKVKTIL